MAKPKRTFRRSQRPFRFRRSSRSVSRLRGKTGPQTFSCPRPLLRANLMANNILYLPITTRHPRRLFRGKQPSESLSLLRRSLLLEPQATFLQTFRSSKLPGAIHDGALPSSHAEGDVEIFYRRLTRVISEAACVTGTMSYHSRCVAAFMTSLYNDASGISNSHNLSSARKKQSPSITVISRFGTLENDMQTPDYVLTAWKGESVSSWVGEESFWVGHAQEGAEDVVSVGLPPHPTPLRILMAAIPVVRLLRTPTSLQTVDLFSPTVVTRGSRVRHVMQVVILRDA